MSIAEDADLRGLEEQVLKPEVCGPSHELGYLWRMNLSSSAAQAAFTTSAKLSRRAVGDTEPDYAYIVGGLRVRQPAY